MNKQSRIFNLVVCIVFVTSFSAFSQNSEQSRIALEDTIECSHCSATKALVQREAAAHFILDHPFDVRHYRIELQPDFSGGTLSATTEIRSVSSQDGLSEIRLNFAGPWNIGTVMVGGVPTTHHHNGSVLTVTLPNIVDSGGQFTVRVSYNGVPTNISNRFPAFAMGNDWAYTHSQPFSARYWFPCFDEPSDKAEDGVDFYVTVSRSLNVAANGRRVSVEDSGLNRVHHWQHAYPIVTYLFAVAINEYEVIEDQYEDIYLHYYVYPQARAAAAFDFGRHGQMLKLFNEKFGMYPFDSYGSVMVPARGWAMENQTMTFYADNIITGDRRFEQTVAHELAHHWWGDSVTLDDYRHIWLNEGFASFAQIVWAEHLSATAKTQTLAAFRRSIETDDQRKRHSLYRADYTQLFSRTIYRKGAYVMHMLRWELGDKDFFEAMRTYHTRFKHSTAVTDDFQAVMEEVSGKDLDGFFEGWVYGTGWPKFAISSYEMDTADGQKRIITVQQTQNDPTRFAVTLPIDPDGNGPLPSGKYFVDDTWEQFEVPVGKGSAKAYIESTDWLLMDTEVADYPAPKVSKIKGRKLRAGRKGKVTLVGENFTPVTRVLIDSSDVTIRSTKINAEGTEITIKVRIAGGATKAKFGFSVFNPDGDKYDRGKGLRISAK